MIHKLFVGNINIRTRNTICHMTRNYPEASLAKSYSYEESILTEKTPDLPHTEAKSTE